VVASLEILLHTIYDLSPQTYLSISVTRRCDHYPYKPSKRLKGEAGYRPGEEGYRRSEAGYRTSSFHYFCYLFKISVV